ncbi:hypothetical protein [Pseudonocardia adelaidensis]|uniref:KTSC domain-containing protein n=1 Tax=Pseudonocardia adelaidensis TaxID=648754 RepID=A0ABP9NYX5_9PSEU
MATTKPDIKSIKLSDVSLWAADDGSIHITSDDPDAKGNLHTYVNNNPASKRYHPAMYAQFARILTKLGKTVPGWEDDRAPE